MQGYYWKHPEVDSFLIYNKVYSFTPHRFASDFKLLIN